MALSDRFKSIKADLEKEVGRVLTAHHGVGLRTTVKTDLSPDPDASHMPGKKTYTRRGTVDGFDVERRDADPFTVVAVRRTSTKPGDDVGVACELAEAATAAEDRLLLDGVATESKWLRDLAAPAPIGGSPISTRFRWPGAIERDIHSYVERMMRKEHLGGTVCSLWLDPVSHKAAAPSLRELDSMVGGRCMAGHGASLLIPHGRMTLYVAHDWRLECDGDDLVLRAALFLDQTKPDSGPPAPPAFLV